MKPPHVRLRRPRNRAEVPPLRHAATAWAETAGLPPRTVADLALVVTELAANAVEHGSGRDIEVELGVGDGRVQVAVHDAGRWRPPPSATTDPVERGRGLRIVRGLSGQVIVTVAEHGTVARAALPITGDTSTAADAATLRDVAGP